MQVPSCTNVRIRSTADVHKIFYAVYLGLLPMITRRLDAKEREALSSGYCYAWEDRGPHAITGIGIERFTEGRHWSASRVRDVCPSYLSHRGIAFSPSSQEFLFYYEKWEPPKNKNGERARLVARTPVGRNAGSIQWPSFKVMDSLRGIGTRM
jgi:Gti1/Pac2 family transcription factor